MKKVLKIVLAVIVVIALFFVAYLETGHYNATAVATEYSQTDETSDYISYEDDSQTTGFIFYPGAKVESSAYSYLSDINANVYIAKFPFELAMFDYKIADQIIEDNPQITNWYIGGHSLGGVFANRYAITTENKIDGVVYLASYPAESDITDIPSLAMFGADDLVVGDYHEKLELFTDSATVEILEEANHSGFGNYGQQKGDSELTSDQMSAQKEEVIKLINKFI